MKTASDVIARLASDPTRSGLVMDFDGVLAPIVDDPAASALLPGAAEVLDALSRHLAMVGLLSGRPVSFLRERVPGENVVLMGSYGVETWVDGEIRVLPAVAQWQPAVAEAEAELRRMIDAAGVPGIHVEGKGLAVAVHWRQARERVAAAAFVEHVVREVAAKTGLRREPGKLVEELRAPVDEDKGTGLQRAIRAAGVDAVAYAGDDRGDLPAFAAVLALGGDALVVGGVDIAPEVAAVDGVAFSDPEEFLVWMKDLATVLDAQI
ncbi:trehalose-phosphatase [Rhodococcus sp. ACPA4]|uniref:Trehalose 6-phosphate phosphatase n=1 Tax=Nocardia globerula TaxID=1818 RepID=A0A652YLZ6_NOCGL|nr:MULTISPECIES: trehalose-phosphatase [Rhodococcus]NMD62080.1 trehalose-phosphatase [Nocardia globerula]MCE4263461.1 trehalose-phosphatase [Rhodococcus globerulus]PBC40907.1 trehalose-phosphatase [Rhodococcus sp. ACPA4]PVX65830.1 trehalose 6-phosphate phosphatase [Rhodococcus globerulus]QXW03006.1 trehalose-phosphatase [Rhodococcus globerulus]